MSECKKILGASGGEKVVISQMFKISSRSSKLSIILIFFSNVFLCSRAMISGIPEAFY